MYRLLAVAIARFRVADLGPEQGPSAAIRALISTTGARPPALRPRVDWVQCRANPPSSAGCQDGAAINGVVTETGGAGLDAPIGPHGMDRVVPEAGTGLSSRAAAGPLRGRGAPLGVCRRSGQAAERPRGHQDP